MRVGRSLKWPGRVGRLVAGRWLDLALLLEALIVAEFAFGFGQGTLEQMTGLSDLVWHVFSFALAASLLSLRLPPLASACWLVLVGATIEAVQSFLPGHQASWLDLAADLAGLLLGLLFVVLCKWLLRSGHGRHRGAKSAEPVNQRAGS